MEAIHLAKAYDPKSFEDRMYSRWMEQGCFKPETAKKIISDSDTASKNPFVIVLPPPNVTGVLHMGHGLNAALQDILIRLHRMLGKRTLWVPGTDHAGIATQHVMERRLKEQGSSRLQLGREAFIKETWKLSDEHHASITKQLEKLGCACDWSRERFTLDEGLSHAVREAFVTLYERGLVYRGKYLVNWCTTCGTALSDDEVKMVEQPGTLYYIRYEIENTIAGVADDLPSFIEVATTRPETIFGDTALACHPKDMRYTGLLGRRFYLPLTKRLIPLIADTYVDPAFGTGVLKITPAHDIQDFEVGRRHTLAAINILNPDGTLNNLVPDPYQGMAISIARETVVKDLLQKGYITKEVPINHAIGQCYRCQTRIEPYLSEQWFVKMKPLAEKALHAWKQGNIHFFPSRWENTYEHWLTTIRDWCISRQLWWGHRIPAWKCNDCGKHTVARQSPQSCTHCGCTTLQQDEDVLDTWFSSWLWPFSVLGWPKQTADVQNYYPTTTLVTGYDIIFFWVARMIMAGMEFMNQVPFHDVYITPLVRDKQGRKMSKSAGNGIDPLEIVQEYGSDALKFTLAFQSSQGQDLLIDKDSFKLGSRFANKVWNASRYLLMNLEGRELLSLPLQSECWKPQDLWIRGRLGVASDKVQTAMRSYRFNDGALAVYEFFWNEFCDCYIEATKLSLRSSDNKEKDRAITILMMLLEESLRLLHPFIPMVSEEIYGKLPQVITSGYLLANQPYPDKSIPNQELDKGFSLIFDAIRQIRNMRAEFTISKDVVLKIDMRFDSDFAHRTLFNEEKLLFAMMANCTAFSEVKEKLQGCVVLACDGYEIFVHIKGSVDIQQLVKRLHSQIQSDEAYLQRMQAKISNSGFLSAAPAEVIQAEKKKLQETKEKVCKLKDYLRELA